MTNLNSSVSSGTGAAAEGQAGEAREALSKATRVVVKIGTNTIMRPKDGSPRISAGPRTDGSAPSGGIDVEYLHRVAAELADLLRAGKEVILVTSGAVGMKSSQEFYLYTV